MASPGDLIEAVSGVTGVALPTVVDMDRRLVKAGLRSKNGRGLNAARMTSLDAARLLTALLASPQANKAAEAVERYSDTVVDRERSSIGLFGPSRLEKRPPFTARQNFIDGLACLLDWTATDPLFQVARERDPTLAPRMEVFAFTRATRGRIRLTGLPDGTTISVEYAAEHHSWERTAHGEAGDLEQSRRVTERTIITLGELLREDHSHA